MNMEKQIIAPSILAADFGNLQQAVEMINESVAEWLHIDIMDGVFVPNISFGMPVFEAIAKHSTKILDVHLMIVEPERYIETFAKIGANNLTIHIEACKNLDNSLLKIRQLGMKAGVAINPNTAIDGLEKHLNEIDIVCVMSVYPGFGGQSFIEETYLKIEELKKMIVKNNAKTLIEVDGGISLINAKKIIAAGANVLVAGSSVFNANNPNQVILEMRNL